MNKASFSPQTVALVIAVGIFLFAMSIILSAFSPEDVTGDPIYNPCILLPELKQEVSVDDGRCYIIKKPLGGLEYNRPRGTGWQTDAILGKTRD